MERAQSTILTCKHLQTIQTKYVDERVTLKKILCEKP